MTNPDVHISAHREQQDLPEDPEETAGPNRSEQDPQGWHVQKRLLRSRRDRMVTGLAAGTADYLGIDPVWLRAGLVVLAFMTAGVAMLGYFVVAILVPEEPLLPAEQPRGGAEALSRGSAMVFGLLLIGFGLLWLLATLDIEFDLAVDIDWVLVLASALVAIGALLVLTGGRLLRGPLIALGVLLALLLTPVASIGGIPENGGAFGDRVARVGSVAALDDDYSHAFGSLTVDLRNLTLPEGTTTVSVNSAFGEARVLVPSGAAVRVMGNGAFGSIEALGEESGGIGYQHEATTDGYENAPRKLVIDVNSAFGSVEVRQ